jgi:hypothetical protein
MVCKFLLQLVIHHFKDILPSFSGSQNEIMAKLDALIANKALLQGTRYAMSEEIFEKAKFDTLTSKYN